MENGHLGPKLEKTAEEYRNKITKNNQTKKEISTHNVVKLPWLPKLGSKLRKEFRKFNIKAIFKSNKNLKTLLSKNKSKLLSNSYAGIYQLPCSCEAIYFGKTNKMFNLFN